MTNFIVLIYNLASRNALVITSRGYYPNLSRKMRKSEINKNENSRKAVFLGLYHILIGSERILV